MFPQPNGKPIDPRPDGQVLPRTSQRGCAGTSLTD
jgi:hypothetical protein